MRSNLIILFILTLLADVVTSFSSFNKCPSRSSTKLEGIRSKWTHVTAQTIALMVSFGSMSPQYAVAAEELPSLEKIFNAVRKEISKDGESLKRLKNDVDQEKWDDILTFTREYDAGFRGGVLKAAWKQLGDKKGRGIELSNSFTFDLIALNKAARTHNKDEALVRLEEIKQDLVNFEKLDPNKK
jgi:hypothetical protein